MTVAEMEHNLETCKEQAALRLRSLLNIPPGYDNTSIREFIDIMLTASLLEASIVQKKVLELNNGNLHSSTNS